MVCSVRVHCIARFGLVSVINSLLLNKVRHNDTQRSCLVCVAAGSVLALGSSFSFKNSSVSLNSSSEWIALVERYSKRVYTSIGIGDLSSETRSSNALDCSVIHGSFRSSRACGCSGRNISDPPVGAVPPENRVLRGRYIQRSLHD